MPFSNFWRIELCHGAAFLTDNAQLTLVCSTAGTKGIIYNDDNLPNTQCIYKIFLSNTNNLHRVK